MTSNQIAAQQARTAANKAREEERHNREMEKRESEKIQETRRHNLKDETGKYGYYGPGSSGGTFDQRINESSTGEDMYGATWGQGLDSAGKFLETVLPFKITFKA